MHRLYPRKSRGYFIGVLIMRGANSVIYSPESKHRKPAEIATDLHLYQDYYYS